MSVKSVDLLVNEIAQEQDHELDNLQDQKDTKNCFVSNKGITIFGYTLSWLVIILIAGAIFFYLRKNNMLNESVGNIVSQPMTGGFSKISIPEKINFNLPNPCQIRKLYGHY